MLNFAGDVFVFGTDQAGSHTSDDARAAVKYHDAKPGQGEGRQGRSYGIVVRDESGQPLPLEAIGQNVQTFLLYAAGKDYTKFNVRKIACDMEVYGDREIAPLFRGAPPNCFLARGWRRFNGENQ